MGSDTGAVELIEAARRAVPTARTEIKEGDGGGPARFELYHAGMSLCSQKIRAVLAHKNIPYLSHDLVIICHRDDTGTLHPADHYHPSYVRLRLHAKKALDVGFAQGWTGITSVATEGFDACVVPTLVDLETSEVIVDSHRIVDYIEAALPEQVPLVPRSPVAARTVAEQLTIIDQTPHGALLVGFHPDDDRRPDVLKHIMLHYEVDKVEALQRLLRENAGEPGLVAAYEAKMAKEATGERICHDDQLMREARDQTKAILADLEQALKIGQMSIFGMETTLADLLWAVSLFRLKYLGLEKLWSAFPHVRSYWSRLSEIPAIKSEVIAATINSLPKSAYV